MKNLKRWTALALALCMAVPNTGVLAAERQTDVNVQEITAASAEEADSAAWKENAEFLKEYEGEEQIFNGNRVDDLSEFAEAVHGVNTGSIILRFKVDADCPNNAVLLAAKDRTIAGNLGTGANCTTMYVQNQNAFRFAYQHTVASLGGPYSFTDGNWHSIVLSSLPTGKSMRLTIDGQEMWSNSADSNRGMFAKQAVLDQVTIGGYLGADATTISNGFKGAISEMIVTSQELTDDQAVAITREGYSGEIPMGSGLAALFNNAGADTGDNTWVFTGGEAVWGPYAQLGGARNYMGHFEEYIRNQKTRGDDPTRQRYTINTAKEGQTLADIVDNWDVKVTQYQPKAVAYMVGAEDYKQGADHIEAFKESLKQFIDKALAEKPDNGSFAVIQKPFAVQDDEVNALIAQYCTAVDEVIAGYKADAAKYDNLALIDHFAQTKDNADFKANKLNEDGTLNELGHLEIGRQLTAGTITIDADKAYPCNQGVRMGQTETVKVEEYLGVMPAVTAAKDSLSVTIPEENGADWKYLLDIEGMTVSDTVSGNTFTITDLPAGSSYVLKIQSADGKIQLTTVKGVVTNGTAAVKNTPELNENQQRLAQMMEEKDSMTWLFMGDSITHALVYTYGYAGTAQTVEKYLRDGLGRKDDVVINTAVSGAWTVSTLNNITQRLEKYTPDVVAIMLGTNDAFYNPSMNMTVTADEYEANLRDIISRIKAINEDAVIVLRCPTPMTNTDGVADPDGNTRKQRALINTERMKKVAADNPDIIYVDQFTEMNEALASYPWLGNNNQNFLGNWLHPGINGQQMMAKQFLKGCGIWTEDNAIGNLYYEQPITKENSSVAPVLQAAVDQIGLSVEKLRADSGLQLGAVTIRATAENGTKSYETKVKDGEAYAVLRNLPEGVYNVEVSSYLKNAAKNVTFASQTVTLDADDERAFDILLSSAKTEKLAKGSTIGKLSMDEMAPEGTYIYSLCKGEGDTDNARFVLYGTELKAAETLTAGETYSVRVKAAYGKYVKEKVFAIYAAGKGLVFEKTDLAITSGQPVNLSEETYADRLMGMEEGSFVVDFTSTDSYLIQSLFSIANGSTANGDSNRHFHLYATTNGALGVEIRNNDSYGFVTANGVFTHGQRNRIALKADKEKKEYKLFVNGELVKTVDAANNYRFVPNITGVNSVQIGATNRGNTAGYPFGGTVHDIKVYETALSDDELKVLTKGESISDTDKSALEDKVREAESLSKEDYTGSSYQTLEVALENARIVLGDSAASQPAIDAAYDALTAAIEKLDKLYTVTVNGEAKKYAYNTPVTITAEVPEGKKFAGWSADDEVISMAETYKFYVAGDITLTAVFTDEEAEEMKAEALLSNLLVMPGTAGKLDVRFVGQLVLPKDYKIKEAGLLWSTKDVTAKEAEGELVLDAGVKKTCISKISDTYQFSVTVKGMPSNLTLQGKIFAKVQAPDGSVTQYIFSKQGTSADVWQSK